MSGLTNLTGEADGPPLHMNFPIGDTVAGVFGAFAIVAELLRLQASSPKPEPSRSTCRPPRP